MKRLLISSLLAGILGGCSQQGGGGGLLTLSGTNGSGDLVPLMMQCATSRGGHATTNPLPVIQASWVHQTREAEDIILVSGDHFTEVQKVLEQAYGAPDSKLGSLTAAPLGNGRTLTYVPPQCGTVLNLTATPDQTIVSIMGRKP